MYLEDNKILLSGDKKENLITYKGKHYQVDFLNDDGKYIHGGNGVVFKLTDEQENRIFVIKFLIYPEQHRKSHWKIEKKIIRFEIEIEALFVAKDNELPNVVGIEFFGTHPIGGLDFHFYVMQKCDCTLRTYMSKNDKELGLAQRTVLCSKILLGIKGLHDYKIYHRDIKHDNIYLIGNEPFIGDLGLAMYQDSDIIINEKGELIGPTGWFSPEAINKSLVEKSKNPHGFDCKIDAKSEVFQLGKLFWYIYQGNIPIGQVIFDDFVAKDNKLFSIIFKMLSYSKEHRSDTDIVAQEINSYLEVN